MAQDNKEQCWEDLSSYFKALITPEEWEQCDFTLDYNYDDGSDYKLYQIISIESDHVIAKNLCEIGYYLPKDARRIDRDKCEELQFRVFWYRGLLSLTSHTQYLGSGTIELFVDLGDIVRYIIFDEYPVEIEDKILAIKELYLGHYECLERMQINKGYKRGWLFHRMGEACKELQERSDFILKDTIYRFHPLNPATCYKRWGCQPDLERLKPYVPSSVSDTNGFALKEKLQAVD